MIAFTEVLAALQAGKQVMQNRWDKDRVLAVRNRQLVQMLRGNVIMPYQLDWREMNRNDWCILLGSMRHICNRQRPHRHGTFADPAPGNESA